MNSILDNEGVWPRRSRTCGYCWKTPNSDHTHRSPVTRLPSFHLLHPAQGRGAHRTSHNTALPWPAAWHRQSENQTTQRSEEKAGGRRSCQSYPLPRWCSAWKGEDVITQSQAKILPCTMSYLQTGFSLVPQGCRHFKSQVCKQTRLLLTRASVTCPARSPPPLRAQEQALTLGPRFAAHSRRTVQPGHPTAPLTGKTNKKNIKLHL